MTGQIPLVDYLVLDDGEPHLIAQECAQTAAPDSSIGAMPAPVVSRPNSSPVAVATEGTVRAFTIVTFAAPGIPTPFVASVVDCDGTRVRANLVNVEPDPEHVRDVDESAAGHLSDRHRLSGHRGDRLRLRARDLTIHFTKEQPR